MELTYDQEKLELDMNNFDMPEHAIVVLEQVRDFSDRLITTVEGAQEYIEKLKVVHCGGIHESNNSEIEPENCPLQERNISCLHGFDLINNQSFGYKEKELALGYNMFGIKFFAIAYYLVQNGYENLNWHLSDSELSELEKKHIFNDDEIEFHHNSILLRYDNGGEKLIKYQNITGKTLGDKYVEPAKIAMGEYIKKYYI